MVTKVKAKKQATSGSEKPAKKTVAAKAVKKAPVEKAKKSARAGRKSTSKLSSKNQLTVPVDILRSIGLTTGDEVEFTVNDAGFIEVKPVIEENPLLQLAGIGAGIYDDFDLAKDRESWSRPWDL
jgi:bifunctional DNA-binding transcriptional regulator/antitoxin component of YhaV-PrlF toxin-antitoxin module